MLLYMRMWEILFKNFIEFKPSYSAGKDGAFAKSAVTVELKRLLNSELTRRCSDPKPIGINGKTVY